MKFEYNGKIYSPSNLEKKLKKLGITIEDIKIIEEKIEKDDNDECTKQQVIVRSNEDDIRRVCYVDKNKSLPTIMELFKHQMWNPETKTGIKELTKEKLETFYYEILC